MPEPAVQFGLFTPPQQVAYEDIARVWREADAVPEIAHAWLFDHYIPIGGPPHGPILEGWTLLSALAAQTARLRLGLMVTSNRFRSPAVLAKIATTVDVVSGGRLEFGIGAGSRPSVPIARSEYAGLGLPYDTAEQAVSNLAESLTIIKRLWTADGPFDSDGYVHLEQAFQNPKPVQRPHPPIVIGGRATPTLRVVAEHADVWNIPGGDPAGDIVADTADRAARSALLDRLCAETGRDPAQITRSMTVALSYDAPDPACRMISAALDAGFRHFVLSLPTPYPDGVAHWVRDAIIARL